MIVKVSAVQLALASMVFCGAISCLAQQTPLTTGVQAGASAANTEDLQKASQNPVASMISVPIQNNSNFGVGPYDRIQNVLNIQPVIPVTLTGNWNVIVRWIIPVVWQPAPGTANLEVYGIVENTPEYFAAQNVQKDAGAFGFGDMNPTFFFAPSKPHKIIWGFGPAFILPTASSRVLGQGKFSAGPSLVALAQPGHWSLGVLVNNVWSVAGSGGRAAVNQMTLQYFINYNLSKGWYLTSAPILTANWSASTGNEWVVPFGGGVGRIMRLGFQPVNISASFYGNVARPSGASPWGMRLQIAFLFPK